MIRIACALAFGCFLIACGSPEEEGGAEIAGARAQSESLVSMLVGTWAAILTGEDAEMALETLEDGTALGFEMHILSDGTGKTGIVDPGSGRAFTWTLESDGTLVQIYDMGDGQTRESRYRIEQVGKDRVQLISLREGGGSRTYLKR